MPDPTTIEEAIARITKLEGDNQTLVTSHSTLTQQHGELNTAKTALDGQMTNATLEIAKHVSTINGHETIVGGLRAELTTAQTGVATGAEAVTKLAEAEKSLGDLNTEIQADLTTRLKGHGIKDEILTGKSVEVLKAMEQGVLATQATSAGGTVAAKGLGLNGGGGSVPAGPDKEGYSLDRDLADIKKAKERIGVPTT